MFTGIIQSLGSIKNLDRYKMQIEVELENIIIGESIAVNGVCLTVLKIISAGKNKTVFAVDISPETIRKTSLKHLKTREKVNIERALKAGDAFGGHIVSGHVDGIGKIKAIKRESGFSLIQIDLNQEMGKTIIQEGSVAIDGISLTVSKLLNSSSFRVSIIPHTMAMTNLAYKKPGDKVNIELDIIGKYVQKNLENKGGRLTKSYLTEKGFI